MSTRAQTVMFTDMSRVRQAWEGAGGALVAGAISGVLLGFTWWAYLIGVVLSLLGGLASGAQHHTLSGAVGRGALGGALWATALMTAIELSGRTPTVVLPEPAIAFLFWGIVPTAILTAAAWFVARWRRSR